MAMGFKDCLASDVHDVFLNVEEFSDIHTIEFKGSTMQIPLQIDDNEQIEREKRSNQNMDGIYVNQRMIYVAASDFGALPKQGVLLKLDGKSYTVADAVSEYGIYSITLEANRA